jgi:hypothetical protein
MLAKPDPQLPLFVTDEIARQDAAFVVAARIAPELLTLRRTLAQRPDDGLPPLAEWLRPFIRIFSTRRPLVPYRDDAMGYLVRQYRRAAYSTREREGMEART